MMLLAGNNCKPTLPLPCGWPGPTLGPMPPRPWIRSVTPVAPPASAAPRLRNLVYAGLVTGIWAGLISLALYGIGRAAGVPFEVAMPTAGAGSAGRVVVPWFVVLLEPVAAGVIGAVLSAVLLGRRFSRRIVFWGGTALMVVSMAGPVLQPDSVIWSTRIWLAIMHLITWAFVVPQLARIVGDGEPVSA